MSKEVKTPKLDLTNSVVMSDISNALCSASKGHYCEDIKCSDCTFSYQNKEHLKSILESAFETKR